MFNKNFKQFFGLKGKKGERVPAPPSESPFKIPIPTLTPPPLARIAPEPNEKQVLRVTAYPVKAPLSLKVVIKPISNSVNGAISKPEYDMLAAIQEAFHHPTVLDIHRDLIFGLLREKKIARAAVGAGARMELVEKGNVEDKDKAKAKAKEETEGGIEAVEEKVAEEEEKAKKEKGKGKEKAKAKESKEEREERKRKEKEEKAERKREKEEKRKAKRAQKAAKENASTGNARGDNVGTIAGDKKPARLPLVTVTNVDEHAGAKPEDILSAHIAPPLPRPTQQQIDAALAELAYIEATTTSTSTDDVCYGAATPDEMVTTDEMAEVAEILVRSPKAAEWQWVREAGSPVMGDCEGQKAEVEGKVEEEKEWWRDLVNGEEEGVEVDVLFDAGSEFDSEEETETRPLGNDDADKCVVLEEEIPEVEEDEFKSVDNISATPSQHANETELQVGSFDADTIIYSSPQTNDSLALVTTESTDHFSRRTINTTQLVSIQLIGAGATGAVYIVRDIISRRKMALKVIPREAAPTKRTRYLFDEQKMLERFGRDREERLKGGRESQEVNWMLWLEASWSDSLNYYLLMPMFPVTLQDLLEEDGAFPPTMARFYAIEIVMAVESLHEKGIVHRDLKGANIFLSEAGHIVLGDFGFSKDFGQAPTLPELVYQPYWPYGRDQTMVDSSTPQRLPETLVFAAKSPLGSVYESAPEIYNNSWYSFGVDWWAVGVTVFTMLTNRAPWFHTDFHELGRMVMEDDITWRDTDPVDDVTMDFIEQMLHKNPQRRLRSGLEMRSHSYFHGVDWELYAQQRVPVPFCPRNDSWRYRKKYNDFLRRLGMDALSTGQPYLAGQDPDNGSFNYTSEWIQTREFDQDAHNQELEEKAAVEEDEHRAGNHLEVRERWVGNKRVIEVFDDYNTSDEEEASEDEVDHFAPRQLVCINPDSSQETELEVEVDDAASPIPHHLLPPMTPNGLGLLSPIFTPDLTTAPTTAENSVVKTPVSFHLFSQTTSPASPVLADTPIMNHPFFLSASSPNLVTSKRVLSCMMPSKSMQGPTTGLKALMGLGLLNFRTMAETRDNGGSQESCEDPFTKPLQTRDDFAIEAPVDLTVTIDIIPADNANKRGEYDLGGEGCQSFDEAKDAVNTPTKPSPRARFGDCQTPSKNGEVTTMAGQEPLRRAHTTSKMPSLPAGSSPSRKSPLKRAMTVPKSLLRSGTNGKDKASRSNTASKLDGNVEVTTDASASPAKKGVLKRLNGWRKKIMNKMKKESVSL